ncbi:MAG: hypothetical protein RLN99_11090, partial [Kiloniellaceae bacterium]
MSESFAGVPLHPTPGIAAPAGANAAVARFHDRYAAMARRKRRNDMLFALGFAACLAASMVIGDFDPVKIWNGLPRLHEFIVKILPLLRWDS